MNDQLPTLSNTVMWGQMGVVCGDCSVRKGTLKLTLSNCYMALGRYILRYDEVLGGILSAAKEKDKFATSVVRTRKTTCMSNNLRRLDLICTSVFCSDNGAVGREL